MWTTESLTVTHCPPRLLKPARQLRRLRPVRLGAVASALRATGRNARGLELIGRFFPERLADHGLADDWDGGLGDFLRYVEAAGWFSICWGGLDHLYESWMQDGLDDDNPDLEHEGLGMLSEFLYWIPVRYFNFGEEDWLNSVAEELPILCLIRGLVDPTYTTHMSELRVEYDIWDNDLPAGFDPAAFTVPPDTYEPLCWLPDVVRYCARATGNELLDTGIDAVWEHDWSFYKWDRPEDIETLKLLYPPALEGWQRVQAFLRWCDGPEEVDQVIELLFGETMEDNDEE